MGPHAVQLLKSHLDVSGLISPNIIITCVVLVFGRTRSSHERLAFRAQVEARRDHVLKIDACLSTVHKHRVS